MTERISRFLAEYSPDTPCLVVDLDTIAGAYAALRRNLPLARIYYAVKANPASEIVAMLGGKGASFDVASRGEIELCLANHVTPDRLSYGN
ncbi:MAG: type III PLP-dependent enzyme, partial [Alphaproteobacteria bacterium]|nr:type III PLP-dependent enzyme [Alphaproteobacteria bacterium]